MTTECTKDAKPHRIQEEDEEVTAPSKESNVVLQDLERFLGRDNDNTDRSLSLFDRETIAEPVAAMKALLQVVQRSQAETMMGLQDELKQASEIMMEQYYSIGRSHNIALQSGCELFTKYVTRTFLELPDFEQCRAEILERGQRLQTISLSARDRIATLARDFVPAGATVLTHGWSRAVASILWEAKETGGKHFDLIILEGRPDASGIKAAQNYAQADIPVTVCTDAAMGYVMEKVDLVLVGAEGVLENGGVVNKLGTYALATCAHAAGKPVYVAAESYKFARLYPLHQSDLPDYRSAPLEFVDTTTTTTDDKKSLFQKIELDPSKVQMENPPVDFTPAKYITLLFTDLGVLTPSAVSDELIRLYQ